MASIMPDRLVRLLAYIRSRSRSEFTSSGTAQQNSSQRFSLGSQEGQDRRQPVAQTFDSYYCVPKNDSGVFSVASKGFVEQQAATLRARGKERVLRLKYGVSVVFFFGWTLIFSLLVVIWAAACWLIPNACRKKRDISNSVVLVTNAGRGLGRRLAVILGLEAALVVCWDPDKERHMNTVYDIRHRGGRAVGFTVDVSDEAAVTNAAEALKKEVGVPGIVVMSAGRHPRRPLLQWTSDDLEALYHANVTPHLLLLRTFLPQMLDRNDGHLVSIISAVIPCWCDVVYSTTKAGVAALMRGLAEELEMLPGNKIRLTSVYPYHSDTMTLAKMAKIVVDDVLRGRKSVAVPKYSVLWLKLLPILPAPVRKRWRSFMARLSHIENSKTSFEKAGPWGTTCHHTTLAMPAMLVSQTPYETVIGQAPYEMASRTCFDNASLVLKKQKANNFVKDEDT